MTLHTAPAELRSEASANWTLQEVQVRPGRPVADFPAVQPLANTVAVFVRYVLIAVAVSAFTAAVAALALAAAAR